MIKPYLPVGEYGPYPERLRQQFEGVIRRFRTGGQWREMPAQFGAWSKGAPLSSLLDLKGAGQGDRTYLRSWQQTYTDKPRKLRSRRKRPRAAES
ncbi:hypothetical protein GCM10022245_40600 [Streptomyces mayteni]